MVPSREDKRLKMDKEDGEDRLKVATEDGEDLFDSLPDGTIQAILQFLPSRDAVQTSLLARRWRHKWKSVHALRVMDSMQYESANELNKFVNYMLILREPLPLEQVEIESYHYVDDDETYRYVEQWVRYAISRKVQDLRLCILQGDMFDVVDGMMHYWILPHKLLKSSTLVKLELTGVQPEGPSLDLSSCPLLKDLKMYRCDLLVERITSPSLTQLSIKSCCFMIKARTQISTPNLVFLQLMDCRERTPLLDNMPKLVSAFVRLRYCSEYCEESFEIGECDDLCECSLRVNDPGTLLEGLSCAAHLELTAEKTVFILRRDLTRCPVFSKLKTLLLSDWCFTANLEALVCLLQHSPILKKLILQLPEIPEDIVGKVGIYGVNKQPFMMEHLTVEVKCHEPDDERIHQIVGILGFYGIPPEQIKIHEPPILYGSDDPWPSGSFSFEQKRT